LGIFLIVPVVLFFIDVGAAVMAQMANDALAKEAARSAAEAQSGALAQAAAASAISNYFQVSHGYVVPPQGSPEAALVSTTYNNAASGVVTIKTNIICNLPVPLAGWSSIPFTATATEPIVAILPGSTAQ
jgi:hypothetical protein